MKILGFKPEFVSIEVLVDKSMLFSEYPGIFRKLSAQLQSVLGILDEGSTSGILLFPL